MAANKVSKNIEKTGEVAIITSIATLAVWGINMWLKPPADVSAAALVVISAVLGGIYNLIKHTR
jgi:hypothetical protein